MVTEKTGKTGRTHSSRKRPERLRLSCRYSVSEGHGIVLSLTFSRQNCQDHQARAREQYLAALSRQEQTLSQNWTKFFLGTENPRGSRYGVS